MSSFILFAYVWPVVGTLLFCAFGLFLARRDRALYERTKAEAALRQAQAPVRAASAVLGAEPVKADA